MFVKENDGEFKMRIKTGTGRPKKARAENEIRKIAQLNKRHCHHRTKIQSLSHEYKKGYETIFFFSGLIVMRKVGLTMQSIAFNTSFF